MYLCSKKKTMKILHSPFKYRATCGFCKSELSFKDEDITKHAYHSHQEVIFFLTDEIKDAILKNTTNPEISNYIDRTKKVRFRYSQFAPKVVCPYCGNDVVVDTNSGKPNAIIDSYYLLAQNGDQLLYLSDLERTAIYIMFNKKLIPETIHL